MTSPISLRVSSVSFQRSSLILNETPSPPSTKIAKVADAYLLIPFLFVIPSLLVMVKDLIVISIINTMIMIIDISSNKYSPIFK